MSSPVSTGGGSSSSNDTDSPCKSVQIIERQCEPNGTSVDDLLAHAKCICSGPFFEDWLACLGCLAWEHDRGDHGNSNDSCGDPPSDRDAALFSSAMTTASEALCTGTPLAPLHSMYNAGRLFADLADVRLAIPWEGLGVGRRDTISTDSEPKLPVYPRVPQATDSIDDTTLVVPGPSTSVSSPTSTASATPTTDDGDIVTVTTTIVVDPDANSEVSVSTASTSAVDPISNSDISLSTVSTSAVVDTVSISDAPPPPPPTDSASVPGPDSSNHDATVTVTVVVVDPDPTDSLSTSIITTLDPVSNTDAPPPTASTTASVVVARGVVVQGDSDSSAMSRGDPWAWLAASAALLAAAAAIA